MSPELTTSSSAIPQLSKPQNFALAVDSGLVARRMNAGKKHHLYKDYKDKEIPMSNKVKPVPDGYHTATPYLTIRGAAAAIDFYKRAFGAQELFRMPTPDGKIMHAEITIGDSHIMLADESSIGETKSPQTLNGSSTGIFLYLNDVDAAFKQAVKAGAKETMPLQNMFWGDRFGKLTDPFGHRWMLATHVEDVSPAEIEERMAATATK
jgi:PhnB protein